MKYFQLSLLLTFLILQSQFSFSQVLTKLHDFDNANGAFSRGNHLITDGTYFYGMTTFGGSHNKGTVYKIKTDGTGFQKLHDFDITNGAEPYNSLALIGSELFGITLEGGTNGWGVLFKISTDGSGFTKLLDFDGNNGSFGYSSMTFNGIYLIGTTFSGGIAGGGSIFRIKPDGTEFEAIHKFDGSTLIDGSQPNFDFLREPSTGYLYGVTFLGGISNKGIVYRIKEDGTGFEKLHDFDGINGENSGDLMLLDGYLYACTLRGGANGKGIIYKIRTDGSDFTKLHDFEQISGTESLNALIFEDGYLYGTTISGGTSGVGVIFKIRTDGTEYAETYAFSNESGQNSWSSMIPVGSDFYGITESGGVHGYGTIFKFDPDGVLSTSENLTGDFKIFPNPAQDYLYVKINEPEDSYIHIYDASGKLVIQQLIAGKTDVELNVSNLNPGIYLVKYGNKTSKFIKN